MQIPSTTKTLARGIGSMLLLLCLSGLVSAQSTDIAWPSPVRTNEVSGTIHARDLGDPRVTDHFYAFTGTPGDVLITVDSRNLNGDVDVFTFSGLRPLLKFTVYAGGTSLITKSIYLRQQEDLILRVEGRTPNDDDAVYLIRFGGAFNPITSGPLAEHEDAIPATTAGVGSGKQGSRVTSAGARIDEPRTEVAAAPTPQPTPVEPASEPKPVAARPTSRTNRPRRPTTRRTRPVEPKSDETAAKSPTEAEGAKTEPDKAPAETTEPKAPAAAKRGTKKGRAARAAAAAPAVQEPEDTGPRLVIETSDGTLIDRYMSGVRRVTVEGGLVVVIGKDGKIQRIPLASVVRMTISP